ncbi:hypothetical protein GQ44DRAFT_719434 [Phaeosphaeriaceae sp. PMI808]|nr:hypothetical protein GQ44DRAFT_719434 [Phaeosphaeriaceae sp. PMI808]
MLILRPPLLDPKYTKQGHFPIQFCHPGYVKKNTLFTLWATDESAPGTSGLYARFALDACAIVAANRHDGWLSIYQDIDDARKHPIGAETVLHGRKYYYHLEPLPDDELGEPYKIVPHFGEWEFPHDGMPPHWQDMAADRAAPASARSRSNLSDALRTQDGYCSISRCREKLQAAHIVPQVEGEWFERNNMSIYNSNQTIVGMDDIANAILLRADLHLAYDEPKFTFVPKGVGSSARLFIHLVDTSEELVDLYHNRPLTLSSLSIEMLYARLAWTIFHRLGSFLQVQVKRQLALTVATSEADSRGFVSPFSCKALAGLIGNRARSKSPNKHRPPSPHPSDKSEAIYTKTCNKKRKFALTSEDKLASSNVSHLQGPELSLISNARSSSSLQSSSLSCSSARFDLLRYKALENERERSDKIGFFAKEAAFAREVWEGRAISNNEAPRFYMACGIEYLEPLDNV